MKMVDPMARERSKQLNLASTGEQVLYLSILRCWWFRFKVINTYNSMINIDSLYHGSREMNIEFYIMEFYYGYHVKNVVRFGGWLGKVRIGFGLLFPLIKQNQRKQLNVLGLEVSGDGCGLMGIFKRWLKVFDGTILKVVWRGSRFDFIASFVGKVASWESLALPDEFIWFETVLSLIRRFLGVFGDSLSPSWLLLRSSLRSIMFPSLLYINLMIFRWSLAPDASTNRGSSEHLLNLV